MTVRRRSPVRAANTAAFGRQMRRYRVASNLHLKHVAAETNVDLSFVSKIETGHRRCSRDFALRVDEITHAGGALIELWDDLATGQGPVPGWFDWPAIEAEADTLVGYQISLVPGLLQTPAYAASMLPDEEAVKARLARQALITREPQPSLTFLIDEQTLHRWSDDPADMREQLEHLLAVGERPNVHVLIVPGSVKHTGNVGSFAVAIMPDRGEVGYIDTAVQGMTVDEPDHLATLMRTLDNLRALALPAGLSRDLIRKVMEDRWNG